MAFVNSILFDNSEILTFAVNTPDCDSNIDP